MMKLVVGYNTKEEELEIARRIANKQSESINAVITHAELETLKKEVASVHMDEEVEKYMIELVSATRDPAAYGIEEVVDYLLFGASPRVSIDIFKAVKAMAFLRGKDYVSPVDIAYIIKEIMRHRLILTYEAEAEGITTDEIIDKIVQAVAIP